MGVAEGDCAVRGLGDEDVDAVLVELRRFLGDAALQGGERAADLEGGVMRRVSPAAREGPSCQDRLGWGAEHLEFAAGDAAGGEGGGVERGEIVTAADERSDVLGLEGRGRRHGCAVRGGAMALTAVPK